MIPKQDRQGVRKAADIEQKYDLDKDYSAIVTMAKNAQSTANHASSLASSAKLTAEEAESKVNAAEEEITDLDERVTALETTGGPSGEDGVTFTPAVDSSGNLSWTNNGGLANPSTVNIRGPIGPAGSDGSDGATGPAGADGKDGVTFTPAVDSSGNLSWTNNGGLANPSTVNIRGPIGPAGSDGSDGATGPAGKDGATGPAGADGAPAKINGVNTLTIQAGDGVSISQSGGTMTISADGGGGGSGVYVGETEPTDGSVNVWINPNGEAGGMVCLTPEEIRAICT